MAAVDIRSWLARSYLFSTADATEEQKRAVLRLRQDLHVRSGML